jgi:hypothetical protein
MPYPKYAKHTMWECRGLKTAFTDETSKKPCRNDDANDNQGGDPSKCPVFQDPSKTVTTIFGGRAVSEDKQERKLVACRVMFVTTYDDPIADLKFLP